MSETTCTVVRNNDLAERYLLGRLEGSELEAFEAHLFECAACFELVQTLSAVRGELARDRDGIVSAGRPRPNRWLVPIAAAAALLVATSGSLLWIRQRAAVPASTATPPVAATAESSRPAPAGSQAADRRAEELLALSRIDPPAYVPLRLRGVRASADFDRAMNAYKSGDYETASTLLQGEVARDPDSLPANFFLGVCRLMTGDAAAASDRLRAAIAAGDSTYRQLAEIFLAKALIRSGDVDGAVQAAARASRLDGDYASDARELLQLLQALRITSPMSR